MSIRTEINESIMDGRRAAFAPEFLGFQGHFPGQPVLPAVVQVLTAQIMIEHELGLRTRLVGLRNAKFLEPVLPGQEMSFTWTAKAELKYQVRITVDDRQVAGFTITLESRE